MRLSAICSVPPPRFFLSREIWCNKNLSAWQAVEYFDDKNREIDIQLKQRANPFIQRVKYFALFNVFPTAKDTHALMLADRSNIVVRPNSFYRKLGRKAIRAATVSSRPLFGSTKAARAIVKARLFH